MNDICKTIFKIIKYNKKFQKTKKAKLVNFIVILLNQKD